MVRGGHFGSNAVLSKFGGVGSVREVILCMLGFLPKKFWVFSSNEGVPCGFCHTALQSFKCVCGAWTYVCIHKAHFLSSPRSAVTAVLSSLHSGVVVHS